MAAPRVSYVRRVQSRLPWTRPEWLAEATAWIRARVDVTGEIEQPHVRWWSTVLRVPTADGDLFFKAVAPIHRFEAALTARLAELQPGRVTEVVEVDRERGWFLMRDAGTRLRELLGSTADLHHWEGVLPEYARLQLEVAPHAGEFLALGTPDERLAVLPDLFRELLATRPPGLTEDELRHAHDAVPHFEEMCVALAEDGLAETIQHDDLHDGQVFVRDGGYLVFDWGDSCVSHPLLSLTVLLRSTAWRLGLVPGGPELRRLRDAYLEPFGRGPEIADIAYWAGTISRAIAWKRMVDPRELEFLSESDLEGPAYGIRLFLAGGPVGSWQEP
jgi:Phosphotransferase enzyme family